MYAWYALYARSRAERRVAQTLVERGLTAFLPTLPATLRQPSRPLFPNYVFVHCDLEAVGLSSLKWIPGLRRILSFSGAPAVVPEEAIALIEEELRRIEATGGLPRHSFKPGDEVVVDSGPLAGLRGIFQGPVGPTERVRILLRFLGHANRTEVPLELLRHSPDEPGGQAHRRGTRGRGRHIRYE